MSVCLFHNLSFVCFFLSLFLLFFLTFYLSYFLPSQFLLCFLCFLHCCHFPHLFSFFLHVYFLILMFNYLNAYLVICLFIYSLIFMFIYLCLCRNKLCRGRASSGQLLPLCRRVHKTRSLRSHSARN